MALKTMFSHLSLEQQLLNFKIIYEYHQKQSVEIASIISQLSISIEKTSPGNTHKINSTFEKSTSTYTVPSIELLPQPSAPLHTIQPSIVPIELLTTTKPETNTLLPQSSGSSSSHLFPTNPYNIDLLQKSIEEIQKSETIENPCEALAPHPQLTVHTGSVFVHFYTPVGNPKGLLQECCQKTCTPMPRYVPKMAGSESFTELLVAGFAVYTKIHGSVRTSHQCLADYVIRNYWNSDTGRFHKSLHSQSEEEEYDQYFYTKEDHFTKQQRRSKYRAHDLMSKQFDQLVHKNKHTYLSLDEEIESFHRYFEEHGYTPNNLKHCTQQQLSTIISYYVQGYGLVPFAHARRVFQERDLLQQRTGICPKITPQSFNLGRRRPGDRIRKIILKGYRNLYPGINSKVQKVLQSQTTWGEWVSNLISKIRGQATPVNIATQLVQDQRTPTSSLIQSATAGIGTQIADELKQQAPSIGEGFLSGVLSKAKSSFVDTLKSIKDFFSDRISEGTAWAVSNIKWILLIATVFAIFSFTTIYTFRDVLFPRFTQVELPEQEKSLESQTFSDWFKLTWFDQIASTFSVEKFDFVKRLDQCNKISICFKNIKEFLSTIGNMLKKAIDWVCECIFGIPFFSDSRLAKEVMNDYLELIKEEQTLDESAFRKDPVKARQFIDKFENLAQRFKAIEKYSDQGTKSRMNAALVRCLPKVQIAHMTFKNQKGRPEPVWINLVGPPDQGKTTMMKVILSALSHTLLKEHLKETHLYNRNPVEEFWSGYVGQWATVVDDIYQSKNVQVRERLSNELIYMRNVSLYPLPMADLLSKGSTFFDSKIIMTTSNVVYRTEYNDLGLTKPEALFRRMDYKLHITLKTHIKHLSNPTTGDIDNWDIEEVVYNPRTRKETKKSILFPELIAQIVKTYNDKQLAHKNAFDPSLLDWTKILKMPPIDPNTNPPPPPPPPPPPSDNIPPIPPEPPLQITGTHSIVSKIHSKLPVLVKDRITTREIVKGFDPTVFTDEGLQKHFDWLQTQVGHDDQLISTREEIERRNQRKIERVLEESRSESPPTTPPNSEEYSEEEKELESQGNDKEPTTSRVYNFFCKRTPQPLHKSLTQMIYTIYHQTIETVQDLQDLIDTLHPTSAERAIFSLIIANKLHNRTFTFDGSDSGITFVSCTPDHPGFSILVNKAFGSIPFSTDLKDILEKAKVENYEIQPLLYTHSWRKLKPEIWKKISMHVYGVDFLCVPQNKETMESLLSKMRSIPEQSRHITYHSAVKFISLRHGTMDDTFEQGLKQQLGTTFLVTLFLTVLGITYSVISAMREVGHVVSPFAEDLPSQSTDKRQQQIQREMNAKVAKRVRQLHSHSSIEEMTSQTSDERASHLALKLITRSMFFTRFIRKDGSTCNNWLLFIKGNIACTTLHSLGDGLSEVQMRISHSSEGETINLIPGLIVPYPERDLVYIKFPKSIMRPDITNHLFDEPIRSKWANPGYVTISDGIALIMKGTSVEPSTRLVESTIPDPKDPSKTMTAKIYVNEQVTRYNGIPTTRKGTLKALGTEGFPGECGAPYLLWNNASEKKLLGIHIAGDKEEGCIAPIYPSDLKPFELEDKKLESQGQLDKTDSMVEGDFYISHVTELRKQLTITPYYDEYHPGTRTVGILNQSFNTPSKTMLRKTVVQTGITVSIDGKPVHLQSPYPKTTAPAMLATTDGIDPVYNSYRKFIGKTVKIPPPFFFDSDVYDGILPPEIEHHELRPLTMEEAIQGVPSMGLPGIDLSTSSAFPWIAAMLSRRKLILRDEKGKVTWIHPELRKEIEFIKEMALKGIIVPCINITCLKDETRPLDRVAKGYTRQFQISALAYLIFTRMYLGAIMIAIEHYRNSDMQVGINPYSYDWKTLYDRLTRFGNDMANILAHDVSGWDICFPHFVAYGFVDELVKRGIIQRNSEWHLCLFTAILAALQSYNIRGNVLWWSVMMPSGHLITSFLNTVFNSVKHRTLFKIRCYEVYGVPRPWNEFNEGLFFGDDSALAIALQALSWWNGTIVAEMSLKYFNHVHTDSNKSEHLLLAEKLSQIFFLQRQFRERNGIIECPLNEDSLFSMVQWVMHNKEHTHETQTEINIRTAIEEWYYHGQEKFEEAQRKLNPFLRALGKPLYSATYADVMSIRQKMYVKS